MLLPSEHSTDTHVPFMQRMGQLLHGTDDGISSVLAEITTCVAPVNDALP